MHVHTLPWRPTLTITPIEQWDEDWRKATYPPSFDAEACDNITVTASLCRDLSLAVASESGTSPYDAVMVRITRKQRNDVQMNSLSCQRIGGGCRLDTGYRRHRQQWQKTNVSHSLLRFVAFSG